MEKIDQLIFKNHEISEELQFFAKGGAADAPTSSQTTTCDSTFIFFEDCNTTTDTKEDHKDWILPMANNMSSR